MGSPKVSLPTLMTLPCTDINQISRSVLLDHKMIIKGVQYHEKKELEKFRAEDGVDMCTLSHMRSIGDRSYKAIQKFVDGEVKDETIETTLAEDEVADFNKDWDKNWEIFDKLSGKRKKSLR